MSSFCERAQSLMNNDGSFRDNLLKQLIAIAKNNNNTLPTKFNLEGGSRALIPKVMIDLGYEATSILAPNGGKSATREVCIRKK